MRGFMSGSLAMILLLSLAGCNSAGRNQAGEAGDDNHVVIERRDDGTRSSAGTVDENGYMHGVLVNYYEDGKTVHSRISYEHGAKQGPAVWYFKDGKVYEHTEFVDGKKQGLSRRYYENGKLMEESTYEKGEIVPGSVKKYSPSGQLITD